MMYNFDKLTWSAWTSAAVLTIAGLVVLSFNQPSYADDFDWDDDADANSLWSEGLNWDAGTPPIDTNLGASNDDVRFGPVDSDGDTAVLDTDVSELEFLTVDSSVTGNYTITNDNAPHILGFSTDGARIRNLDDNKSLTITEGVTVDINSPLAINASSSGASVVIEGGITESTGTNAISFFGNGTIELNSEVAHTGPTEIGAATVELNPGAGNGLLNTSEINISSGAAGGELQVNANEVINDTAEVDLDDANDTFTLNADETIDSLETDATGTIVTVSEDHTLELGANGSGSGIDGQLTVEDEAALIMGGVGSSNISGGGNFTVKQGGEILFKDGGTTTISGTFQGGGDLTVQGSHTVTMTDSNTIAGDVAVEGGVLALNSSDALQNVDVVDLAGSGTVRVNDVDAMQTTATLDLDGSSTLDIEADQTIDRLTTEGGTSVSIGGGDLLSINNSGASSLIEGDVTGSGDLTVLGGDATVTGTTSFSGTTSLEGNAALELDSTSALGGISLLETNGGTGESVIVNATDAINTTADVDLNNSGDSFLVQNVNQTVDEFSTVSSSTTELVGGATLIVGASDGASQINGDVTGTGGLTVSGDGAGSGSTATIDGDGTTFTGMTRVEDQSTLNLETPGALSGTSRVEIDGGSKVLIDGTVTGETINDRADVDLAGTDDVLDIDRDETVDSVVTGSDSDVQIASASTFSVNSAGGASTFDGTITNEGTLEVLRNTADIKSGMIGSGNLVVRNGTTTIDSSTTVSGTGTVDNSGRLLLDNADALGGISSISTQETSALGTQAEIQINNVGSSVINDTASISLNTDRDLLDVDQDETIGTLTTASNTAVDINSTLRINSAGGTSTIDGTVTGPSSANLSVLGGTADVNSVTSFQGTAAVRDTGTLNLNAADALSGVSLLETTGGAGTATVNITSAETINDAAAVDLGSSGDVLDVDSGETIDALTTTSGSDVQLAGGETLWIGSGGSNSTISGDVSESGNLTVMGGTADINTDGTTFSGNATVNQGATLELNTADALSGVDNVQTVSGGGGAEIEVNSAGAINDTGDVRLFSSTDTLDVNEDETIDELDIVAGSSVEIETSDTLTVGSDGNDSQLDGALGGAGNLTLADGTSTITNDNVNAGSYSGTTTLMGPALLEIGDDNALGTGLLDIQGGELQSHLDERTVSNSVDINGDFEVSGTRALTLTGSVDAGNLGAGSVTADITNTADTTISGVLTASNGTLVKTGTGRLVLDADNSGTQTADWQLDDGTVEVQDAGALGADTIEVVLNGVDLDTNVSGTPSFDQDISVRADSTIITSQDTEIGGTISDGSPTTGELEKNGSGTLILSADNSGFSGGVDVQDGDFRVQDEDAIGGASSNLNMGNSGSTLFIDDTGTPNIDNDITASSGFDLTVVQDAEISGDVDGGGDIARNGSGDLELSGSSTSYSGQLDLNSGMTEVSGTFGDGATSEVHVNNGAVLTGSGTIGNNLVVNNGGTTNPGTSPGVMTVNNNMDLNSGSTTVIEREPAVGGFLNSAGTGHDQFDISGNLTTDSNATILLQDLSPGDSTQVYYPDDVSFAAFDVSGSVDTSSGAPMIVDDDNMVDWTLQSDGSIRADRTSYGDVSVSLSDNQENVAGALDSLADSTPAGAPSIATPGTSEEEQDRQELFLEMDAIGESLLSGSASQSERRAYRRMLDSFSPQRYSALFRSQRQIVSSVQDIKSSYLANSFSGPNFDIMSLKPDRPARMLRNSNQSGQTDSIPVANAAAQENGDWGGFFKGVGVMAEEDSTSDRVGYEADAHGAVVGVDKKLSHQAQVGLSFSYAEMDVTMSGMGGDADVNSIRLGPYLNYRTDEGIRISGSISVGMHDQDTKRQTSTGTAEASVDAQDASGTLTVGYDLVDQENTVVEPLVGGRATFYEQDSFTESGAGVSNLSVDSEDQTTIESRVGARFARSFEGETIRKFTPSLTLAWRRQFDEEPDSTNARFRSDSSSTFTVDQGNLETDTLEIGTGINFELSRKTKLFGNYTGLFYEDGDVHSFVVGINVKF